MPSPPRLTNPRLLVSPIDLLCHDLAYLLALLNRDDVQPLHGRWLPPGTLQAWGRYCAVTPVSPHARSELQTGRRRFIHYLAENAGWIGGQGSGGRGQMPVVSSQKSPISHLPSPISNLSPLPAAWLWLNAPRSERLQTLWQTWTQPDPALWRAYRLPGHDWLTDPARLITVVNGELEEWKNGRMDGWNAKREEKIPTFQPSNPPTLQPSNLPTFQPAALLNRHPYLLDLVPANQLDPVETLLETLEQLLTGPLLWLGILGMANSERRMGEEIFSSAAPAYAKFAVETHFAADILDSTLTLTLAGGLPEPADLMVTVEVGSRKEQQGSRGAKEQGRVFSSAPLPLCPPAQINAASFIQSLQRGWSPPALLDALNRLADRPLTPAETALLHAWSELADRVVLRQVTLLETTEPEVITRLASTRRGRALIQQTLSPRAIVVNPAQLDQLVRRLTEQEGVPPKEVGSKKYGVGEQMAASPSYSLLLTPYSVVWLTLQVYQRLGRFLRLPVRLPQALLDQVAGQADPTDLAAAESAAEQVMAGLQQAVEGWAAFPSSPEAGLPVEATLPLIKEALATGQNLDLLYYTAGTDRLTHRIVEPHRLEWRGSEDAKRRGREEVHQKSEIVNRKSEIVNPKSEIVNPPEAHKAKSKIPYLVGFCHAAQAERVFRLDRIQEITLVPRPDEDGQIWEG